MVGAERLFDGITCFATGRMGMRSHGFALIGCQNWETKFDPRGAGRTNDRNGVGSGTSAFPRKLPEADRPQPAP